MTVWIQSFFSTGHNYALKSSRYDEDEEEGRDGAEGHASVKKGGGKYNIKYNSHEKESLRKR